MTLILSGQMRLATFTQGDPSRTPVVLIHGFPDTHRVWGPVTARLASQFFVISYDVRGAGDSDRPTAVRDYRFERLMDDLAAVVDATCPGRPFHLVGHDWGSIQGWEAALCGRFEGRLRTFTSMSGPPLDYAGQWMRQQLTSRRGLGPALRQLSRSWYVGAFHLPLAPGLAWRVGARHAMEKAYADEGIDLPPSPTLVADGVHGINLYRANFVRPLARPRARRTGVPVQLLVARRDPFVTPALLEGLEEVAPHLSRLLVDGGHWLPLSDPQLVAESIASFVRRHEEEPS